MIARIAAIAAVALLSAPAVAGSAADKEQRIGQTKCALQPANAPHGKGVTIPVHRCDKPSEEVADRDASADRKTEAL